MCADDGRIDHLHRGVAHSVSGDGLPQPTLIQIFFYNIAA
jgi:hypothetical protein